MKFEVYQDEHSTEWVCRVAGIETQHETQQQAYQALIDANQDDSSIVLLEALLAAPSAS